jgi:hypothetical protein
VKIINNGFIFGKGGNGGASSPTGGSPGFAGGTALYVRRNTLVENFGTIAGGGGGGGGGAPIGPYPTTIPRPGRQGGPFSGPVIVGGGGGGGGFGLDLGYGGPATGSPNPIGFGNQGSASQLTGNPANFPELRIKGAGGVGRATPIGTSGAGGGGGDWGQAGGSGTSSPTSSAFGTGGAAGNYLDGNSFVTWPSTGTRIGNVI